MPLFSKPKVKKGTKVKVINKEVFPEILNDSLQRNDIRKFSFFSQDFIYIHPDFKYIIADLDMEHFLTMICHYMGMRLTLLKMINMLLLEI